MKANPPWADRALKQSWNLVENVAASKGLPMPVKSPDKWVFEELGCGHYGCVIPTYDDAIVFKLTSDPTEAEFIELAQPLGWPEGIVEYHAIVPLDFTYRRRQVFALWREAAINVGYLAPGMYEDTRDYETRARLEFTTRLEQFKDHAARFRDTIQRTKNPRQKLAYAKELEQWAWDNVGEDEAFGKKDRNSWRRTYRFMDAQRGPYRLAASWRACRYVAEYMANTYLSDLVGDAFLFYMDNGFLLADVHANNVGQALRVVGVWTPWVITDPGHVVVL